MHNKNGRKPTPQGVPRSPVPTDLNAVSKAGDLFRDNPPDRKAIAAGHVLVSENEVFGENAVAYFVLQGELHEQQTCHVIGQGYVTETVAMIQPSEIAFSQALCRQYASRPAQVRVIAAKDSVVLPFTREHLRGHGSSSILLEQNARCFYQYLESRRALREAVELDEGILRLHGLVREKYGYTGTVREFLKALWDAHVARPKLETAVEEQIDTITGQERQIQELDLKVAALERKNQEQRETIRRLEEDALNFAQSYALSIEEQKILQAQTMAFRTQLREAKRGAELAQAESGLAIKDVYDAMDKRAEGANMYLTRITDLLRKRGLPLVLLEQTIEELDLLRTKPVSRNTEEEETSEIDLLADIQDLSLPESDLPVDLRQTMPGYRKPASTGPRPEAPDQPDSERKTIPVPLTRQASDSPKRPRYDSATMPSNQGVERKPGPQRTARWDSRQVVAARDASLGKSNIPKPPVKPPAVETMNPLFSQTAEYDLPDGIDTADVVVEVDEAYDSGRSTVVYDEAPFSEKEKPAAPLIQSDRLGLRRSTVLGVPPVEPPSPKKR